MRLSMISLRVRLWFVLVGLSTAAVIAMWLIVSVTGEQMEDGMIESAIKREATLALSRGVQLGDQSISPDSEVLHWYMPYSSSVDSGAVPAEFSALGFGQTHDVSYEGHVWHVLKQKTPDGILTVALNIDDVEARELALNLALSLGCFLIVVTNAILGWWWSRRISLPLSQLAASLTAESASTMAEIHIQGGDSYVDKTAAAVNRYRQTISEQIERERLFTSAASHELRNPLAVIQSSLQLLALEFSDAVPGSLERASRAVKGLQHITNSLLYLGRSDVNVPVSEVGLEELLQRVCQTVSEESPSEPVSLSVEADKTIVLCEEHLIVVLGNLIRNAQKNSGHQPVEVSLTDKGVLVRDFGMGLSKEKFEQFQGKWAAEQAGGFGLGLHIASQLCLRNGWGLEWQECERGLALLVNLSLTKAGASSANENDQTLGG